MSGQVYCIRNLKELTLAAITWVNDNNAENLPTSYSTNQGGVREYLAQGKLPLFFQMISNELKTPEILACLTDKRKPASDFRSLSNRNISYFINMDASVSNSYNIFAGDRNITNSRPVRSGMLEIRGTDLPGWGMGLHCTRSSAVRYGNIALVDGSVHQSSEGDLQQAFARSAIETNHLVLP